MKIHIIANSHLDPVWLWDWREGLNEGVITCRAVLQMMDEFPSLTYIRGESAVYEHIQRTDAKLFDAIRQKIAEGRWEVVGGTFLQMDTNLPATETLVRHFTVGLGYFQRELGVRPRIAWAADSFGHSAGWPEIYAAAGMTGFAFSRPMAQDLDLPKPAFWWEGASGARVLSWRIPVGWYGTARDEAARRLDATLAAADAWKLENVAAFVGLGNHGGGPSRRQIRDVLAWAQSHRDVEVVFSGLERFFADLRAESAELPVFRGELNFTLRGCYSSAARFKAQYRRTENLLFSTEKTDSVISAALDRPPGDLTAAWRALLFNTFHDILPGSSIERAYDDQFAWLGAGWHAAREVETDALNALAQAVDTSVETPAPDMPCAVPVLVWNPHAYPFDGPVEIEAGVDYRPVESFAGRAADLPVELLDASGAPLPFQRLEPENYFTPAVPWRVRLVTRLKLAAFGWHVVRLAWKDDPRTVPAADSAPAKARSGGIENGFCRVLARVGGDRIGVLRGKKAVLVAGGFQVASYDDAYGSWGGHDGEREADSIERIKEIWRVERTETLASGPLKAVLWTRLVSAGKSRLDLTVSLQAGSEHIHVAARLFCDEPGTRVKLILPILGVPADRAEFEVPGGRLQRGPSGENPGGRWVRMASFAFASDAIFNFDLFNGALNATLVRSTRYACSVPTDPHDMPWRPYMDGGEHRFQFILAAPDADIEKLGDFLEQPPLTLIAGAHAGSLPGHGSFGALTPASVRLLSFKPTEKRDGRWTVRVQEMLGRSVLVKMAIGSTTVELGQVEAFAIATWMIAGDAKMGWSVCEAGADELTAVTR